MSLSCCSHRLDQPDTPQPSFCCFSLSWPNYFTFKITLLRSLYGGCDDFAHMLSSSPMPPLIQGSVCSRCRLLLVAFFVQPPLIFLHLVRFGRSSSLCLFSSSSKHLSRYCCCTTISFFFAFSPSLSGLLFYLLSMHMFIHTYTPLNFFLFLGHHFYTLPSRFTMHFIRLVRFAPPRFACRPRSA